MWVCLNLVTCLLPEQEDLATLVGVAHASGRALQVMRLAEGQGALDLHDTVCGGAPDAHARRRGGAAADSTPLLLLPAGYALLDAEGAPALLAELLLVRLLYLFKAPNSIAFQSYVYSS